MIKKHKKDLNRSTLLIGEQLDVPCIGEYPVPESYSRHVPTKELTLDPTYD